MKLFPLISLLSFAACAAAPAASIALNISMGYLCGGQGASEADRMPADGLFMLVADVGGDGFDDVPAEGWAAGTDVVLVVYDNEFPAEAGGTRGFDLASGSSENGLFSRTLLIDTAQFGGGTGSVSLALRWFPTLKGSGGLPSSGPGAGVAYGEFSRTNPIYGLDSWTINLNGGASYTLDPLATPDLGGTDPEEDGMARHVTVPEPAAVGLLMLLALAVLSGRGRFLS